MKTIIVAGGRGKRLKPITDTIPKPMVEVKGKPILEHIIQLWKKYGFTEFILVLNYLSFVIVNYFGNGGRFGVNIEYIFENPDKPLGTAGSILQAKKNIHDAFMVTYGDILRDLNIKDMLNFHIKKNSFATLNVYKRFGNSPKSMIVFDENKRVTYFKERPNLDYIQDNFVWANGSYYIFEPEIFDYIPSDHPSDFGRDIFPQLLRTNRALYGYPSDDLFIDIGDRNKLTQARKLFNPLKPGNLPQDAIKLPEKIQRKE